MEENRGWVTGLGWLILAVALAVVWLVLAVGECLGAGQPVVLWAGLGEAVVVWVDAPVGVEVLGDGDLYVGTLGVYRFVPQARLVYQGRFGGVDVWSARWAAVAGTEGFEVSGAIPAGRDVYWTGEARRVRVWNVWMPVSYQSAVVSGQ